MNKLKKINQVLIALAAFSLLIVAILACLVVIFIRHPIPLSITNVAVIRDGLQIYAAKHGGAYPLGMSSTEVFQKLVDDNDLQTYQVYFPLEGKIQCIGKNLEPKNVCFDFTSGTNAHSPDWIPIVIPTGYSINYETGEAVYLPTNCLHEDFIKVAYSDALRLYPITTSRCLFLHSKKHALFISPGKPDNFDTRQYHQLTP